MLKMRNVQKHLCWNPHFGGESMLGRGFASLDFVNLVDTFHHRPRLMQAVPWVLRGAFRGAIQEILAGSNSNDEGKATRGLETPVAAKDDLVPTRSGRFCPTLEVGGENHLFSVRCGRCQGPHSVSSKEASSTA